MSEAAGPHLHLSAMLADAAARHADRPALVVKERTFTYRQLDDLASGLARGLASNACVAAGDRVALQMPNSWEYVAAVFALARLGATAVPLSVMLTAPEIRDAVTGAGARLLLASRLKGEAAASLVGSSSIERVLVLADDAKGSGPTLQSLIEAPGSLPYVTRSPDEVASIVYTSGTGGKPRGAELTHRALVTGARMTAQVHGRTHEDVTVTALPLPHVYGTAVVNATLASGGTVVLLKQFSEAEIVRSVTRHRATMIDGVPAMYAHLVKYPGLAAADLSSLTRCTVGGADITREKLLELEERFGVPFLEIWGMTELAGIGLCRALGAERRESSYGRLLPSLELRVVDPAPPHAALAEGDVGELSVRGPTVMRAYHGDAATTADVRDENGWLRLSTIGKVDGDGYVFVLGTTRRLINTAGYKVYPAEVEQVLGAHAAIAVALVVPEPDELRGEIARAYVVLELGGAATEAELLAFCRQRLAAYKVPAGVSIVVALPVAAPTGDAHAH